MPSYQYECKSCQKEWSEYHNYEETPIMCPFCEQKDFKRVYNYTTTINKISDAMEHKNTQKVGSKKIGRAHV